jgi:hypothetical protein
MGSCVLRETIRKGRQRFARAFLSLSSIYRPFAIRQQSALPEREETMLAAVRLPLAQRLVDGLFPAGDGYASRLTVGRRAQLGDEMVYRSSIGSSPVVQHGQ